MQHLLFNIRYKERGGEREGGERGGRERGERERSKLLQGFLPHMCIIRIHVYYSNFTANVKLWQNVQQKLGTFDTHTQVTSYN